MANPIVNRNDVIVFRNSGEGFLYSFFKDKANQLNIIQGNVFKIYDKDFTGRLISQVPELEFKEIKTTDGIRTFAFSALRNVVAIGSGGGGGRGATGATGATGAGGNENIYNIDGILTSGRTLDMDGKFLIFTDGTGKSADFLQRRLYMDDGLVPDHFVVDWQAQQLYRYPPLGGFLSLDWSQSWLTDLNGQVTVAWVDKILYSREPLDIQVASVQWATRELIDNIGFTTLNWRLRELYSTIGSLSANWELRQLFDSTSGDPNGSLDWEAKELHTVWDARDGFKIGTGDTITKVITATDTLDFPDTPAQTSSDLTIALVGAVDGDTVSLGVSNSAVVPDSSYSAWVSAPDTVTVRFNNYSAVNQDPASGTFRVTIMQF